MELYEIIHEFLRESIVNSNCPIKVYNRFFINL